MQIEFKIFWNRTHSAKWTDYKYMKKSNTKVYNIENALLHIKVAIFTFTLTCSSDFKLMKASFSHAP